MITLQVKLINNGKWYGTIKATKTSTYQTEKTSTAAKTTSKFRHLFLDPPFHF